MTRSKFTDILTQALAFCLALSCLAFAGYKVIALHNMENPPADLGLNFPEPKRRIITDDGIPVDPAPTNSITRSGAAPTAAPRIQQPYRSEAPIQDYRLLTVIDGVAFVEVLTLKGKQIVPIAVGARLPGAGAVKTIEKRKGRWVLVAGDVTLLGEVQ